MAAGLSGELSWFCIFELSGILANGQQDSRTFIHFRSFFHFLGVRVAPIYVCRHWKENNLILELSYLAFSIFFINIAHCNNVVRKKATFGQVWIVILNLLSYGTRTGDQQDSWSNSDFYFVQATILNSTMFLKNLFHTHLIVETRNHYFVVYWVARIRILPLWPSPNLHCLRAQS